MFNKEIYLTEMSEVVGGTATDWAFHKALEHACFNLITNSYTEDYDSKAANTYAKSLANAVKTELSEEEWEKHLHLVDQGCCDFCGWWTYPQEFDGNYCPACLEDED